VLADVILHNWMLPYFDLRDERTAVKCIGVKFIRLMVAKPVCLLYIRNEFCWCLHELTVGLSYYFTVYITDT